MGIAFIITGEIIAYTLPIGGTIEIQVRWIGIVTLLLVPVIVTLRYYYQKRQKTQQNAK